jgi:hypothetical protein
MRTHRITSSARWATHARRPWSPSRIRNGSDPRSGRHLGPGRSSPELLPIDEVQIESYVVLENDTALIAPLLARLQERADRLWLFDARTTDRVAVALTEALLDGIQHGNLELDSRLRQEDEATYERIFEFRRRRPPYLDRRLHVRTRLSRREVVYIIRDEGPGFDPSTLPDPTDPVNLGRMTGRGLLLIRGYMDEVAFNRAGNQITLTKRSTTTSNVRSRPKNDEGLRRHFPREFSRGQGPEAPVNPPVSGESSAGAMRSRGE